MTAQDGAGAQTEQTLLMVGVGLMGRPYVTAARRLGIRVRAVEQPGATDGIADQIDGVTTCQGYSEEAWAQAATAAVAEHRPEGVLAFAEPHVLAAAMVQDRLGVPGPSLRAAVLSRNKALQRGAYAAAGVGQPEFRISGSLTEDREWAVSRLPVVVKALARSGSIGVEEASDAEAFDALAARREAEGKLLIERSVSGPEFSWDALVVDGAVWFASLTAKETSGPPHYIEVAHHGAADVDDALRAAADEFGAHVVGALGVRTSLVHVEFRRTPTGLAVMETAVRTPGDFIMDVLGHTYGIDLYEMTVRAALGLPLPPAPSAPRRYAASYLPLCVPGKVVAVEGVEKVLAHPNVVRADVFAEVGDKFDPPTSSNDRYGYVVLAADSRAELRTVLEEVRSTLVVVTE